MVIVYAALIVLGLTAITTWWLTGRFLRFALARELLDVPNARSSHAVPAPRGGGIAIAGSVMAALLVLLAMQAVEARDTFGLVGAGALVATIGMVDDTGHIPAHWRLVAHIASAIWLLSWLGGFPGVLSNGADMATLGYVVGVLYVTWILNLTNFMDGIDGLAGVESLTACLGAAAIYVLKGVPSATLFVPLAVAMASIGFLTWNWPPARIFMGDVGSGFLGLALAACSLEAGWVDPALFWSWIILLGVFVVDATVTLIRRMMSGQKFYQAHRSHAYQHATQRWGLHRRVTLAVAAINVLWLFPLALLVGQGLIAPLIGVLVAYAPLVGAAFWLGAGTTPDPG